MRINPILRSQRFLLAIMLFLGLTNAYVMRICLSVAIIAMVPEKKDINKIQFLQFDERYQWSENIQGYILSSFYIGYVIVHIPGSYLGQRFGGKIIVNIGLFITALCTLATPFAVEYGGPYALMVLRLIMGIGEGPTYSALCGLLSAWLPASERGSLSSIVFSGVQIGSIIATLITGLVIKQTEEYGSIFFIFGVIGIFWNVAFHFLISNSPATHPRISDEEREYLREEIGDLSKTTNFFQVPWTSMLTSVPVWALITAQIGHDWGTYILITDTPKYLADVLHMPLDEVGWYASLPFLLGWVLSIGSGAVGDYLIERKMLTMTRSRMVFNAIAAIFPAIFAIGASYSEYNKAAVVACFVLAMGLTGTYCAGGQANILDLAPNYAAPLMGIVNGIGSITGFAGPALAGELTQNSSLLEWRVVYWITFGVFASTTIIYVIWGSADTQPWNDMELDEPITQQNELKANIAKKTRDDEIIDKKVTTE